MMTGWYVAQDFFYLKSFMILQGYDTERKSTARMKKKCLASNVHIKEAITRLEHVTLVNRQ